MAEPPELVPLMVNLNNCRQFTEPLRHRGTYGSPRITDDLREAGWRVSVNTVAAVMAELQLVARPKRRRRGLTEADAAARKAPDLIGRDFAPPAAPNVAWVGDLTEIPTDEGRCYLASVLDLHSRRVVGFALGDHHDAAVAKAALCMAIAVRGGDVAGVIFYSGQYLSIRYTERLADAGASVSVGSKGDS